MSLVVEDGTGLSNAESYISVADATTYISNFYLSTDPQQQIWTTATSDTGSDAEVALRRSTRDLDAYYVEVYRSCQLTTTQALGFPRQPFYEFGKQPLYFPELNGYYYEIPSTQILVSGIPQALKNATIELALLLLGGFDLTGPLDRSNTTKSEKLQVGQVGVMSINEYFYPSSTVALQTRKINALLAPFLSSSSTGVNVRLVRG
jgi:hypothetical protein